MDIQAAINEKIQQLQDLNKQMGEISQKIGALQEQGRALHNAALEIRGAINALAELEAKEKERVSKSETAKLTLPVGVKPVMPEETPAAPAAEAPKAEPTVTLEVK
jgi:seryl-tRNA synthetase